MGLQRYDYFLNLQIFLDNLFQKHKENSHYEAEECCEVVPLQALSFEHYCDDDCKYRQGNDFLDDFQLHEVEGAAVAVEADAVGRDLCAVFKECDSP